MVYPVRNFNFGKGIPKMDNINSFNSGGSKVSSRISNGIYLFIGDDTISKKRKLDSLKREFLSPSTEEFCFHILYGKEIDLLKFKELLKISTFGSDKRLIVIKDILNLNNQAKEFILSYLKEQDPKTLIILDTEDFNLKDGFTQELLKYAKVFRFRREQKINTFDLSRALERKDLNLSLNILSKLLSRGEKPEKILGSLRYQWVNSHFLEFGEKKKRISLLLDTDFNLKRGRLKPHFALELLIIKLCTLLKFDLKNGKNGTSKEMHSFLTYGKAERLSEKLYWDE